MEVIYSDVQTVAVASNVLFNDTVVGCSNCLMHREGSGLVTLRGATSTQARARYRISFGCNIAVPTGGTVGPVSLAIAINGEGLVPTTMISTPAAVEEYNAVSRATYVDVPSGCCFEVSIRNMSDQAILVQNANLIVERTA